MLRTSSPRSTKAVAAVSVAATAILLMLAGASPAAAHTELVSATPEPGERLVIAAPLTVSLTFTEAIDPALANLVLVDDADEPVDSSSPSVDGATVSLVTRDVPEPGKYVVRYRVVSADGHPVDGETKFTVAAPKRANDPAGTAGADTSAEPGPEPSAPSEGSEDTSGSTVPAGEGDGAGRSGLVVGAVGAAAVLVILGTLARRRSSSSDGP